MFSYRSIKQLLGVSATAILLTGAGNAMALTASGTDITNTATVNYKVSTVSQTAETGSDTFRVDTRVDLAVAQVANATVAPGATLQATEFTLTTESNATMDFNVWAENHTGDNFDLSSLTIYQESGATAGFQSAEDTVVTTLNDIAAGTAAITLYVVGTIPATPTVADTNVATVSLVAEARDAATTNALVEDSDGDNKTAAEIVFATAAGTAPVTTDAINDVYHSASATYTVASADVSVTKSSAVLDDGAGGLYHIPGASVEYTITVTNNGATATADNIVITDPVDSATLTFNADGYGAGNGFDITTPSITNVAYTTIVDAAVNNITADWNGTTANTITIAGTGLDLAAGQSLTIKFKVTIK